jgi:DNA-binding MarR family transcriptional regulator
MHVQATETAGTDGAEKVSAIIDHLVDALGGEPGCQIRRAVILADIDQHPGTTQAEIMTRLFIDKSTANRDIEWLYDYGCIMRQPGSDDARTVKLVVCGYAKKNLDLALDYFSRDHKSLKNFLIEFINKFGQHKPTLRDAKIVAVVNGGRQVTKQEIFENLYNGPGTTNHRAINALVESGFVRKIEEDDEVRA